MADLSEQKFFVTPPHPCSYLPDQEARTLFLDPNSRPDDSAYGLLSQLGFRRSGRHLYRPHCESCRACVAARMAVADFAPRRRHRRIRNRNSDLVVELVPATTGDEYYQLYARYIADRHHDGDMYPPSEEQFRSFLLGDWSTTQFLTLRLDGELVAVAVTDVLPDGLSAIYTFFAPELSHRSLGVYGILMQIEQAKAMGLGWLYLGYWIRDCLKMKYKTEYRPVQLLLNERWHQLD